MQLPGRETRLRERPLTSLEPIVDGAIGGLETDRPVVLYGHSFGALVVFELAHRLRRDGRMPPVVLAVSGRRAPQCTDRESPIAQLTDHAFIETVAKRYGGFPPAVLQSPELMALLLPALRADMQAHRELRLRKA